MRLIVRYGAAVAKSEGHTRGLLHQNDIAATALRLIPVPAGRSWELHASQLQLHCSNACMHLQKLHDIVCRSL